MSQASLFDKTPPTTPDETPLPPQESTLSSWEEFQARVLKCTKCPLHQGRTHVVPGEGNPRAEILFIGEGPGQDEDRQGRPFVGRAGQLLNKLLAEIGLKREEVYIANVVKCRPPNNRDPHDEEILACWPYLEAQIRLINPLMIITLGRHSLGRFLPNVSISAAHGQPKKRQSDGKVIYPVFHPAAALYRASMLGALQEDFRKIPTVLKMIKGKRQQG